LIDCDGEIAKISSLKAIEGHQHVFVESAVEGIKAGWWHDKKYEKPIYLLTNVEVG
jgi:hypothetical protein